MGYIDFSDISYSMASSLGFTIPNPQLKKQNCGCIFHKDNKPSCSIDFEKATYYCYSCGNRGSLFKLFKEYFGQSAFSYFNQNREDYFGTDITQDNFTSALRFFQEDAEEEQRRIRLSQTPKVNLRLEGRQYKVTFNKEATQYLLKGRGFTEEQLETFHIHWTPQLKVIDLNNPSIDKNSVTFTNRILIPIKENKQLLSIEARDIQPKIIASDTVKVLYPKGGSTSTLFNLDQLLPNEDLYITEGLMDLIYLQTSPFFKNATTIMGASVSERQIFLLSQHKGKLIYIRNNDKAGKDSFNRMCKGIGRPIYELLPPDGLNDVNDIYQVNKQSIQYWLDRGWLDTMKLTDPQQIQEMVQPIKKRRVAKNSIAQRR